MNDELVPPLLIISTVIVFFLFPLWIAWDANKDKPDKNWLGF